MTDNNLIPSLSASGLAPGALVLDVGCGTGLQARAMARAGYRVIGVDADVDAVTTGRALADDPAEARPASESPGLSERAVSTPFFAAARGERLPFRDAVFDAVVCRDVLHWVADEAACRALWREAWRVLKPGGLFHVRCVLREGLDEPASTGSGLTAARHSGPWFPVPRALLDALLADGAGIQASPPRGDGDRIVFTARKPG